MMQLLNQSWNGKEVPKTVQINPPDVLSANSINSIESSQSAEAIASWLVFQLAERLGLSPDEIDLHEDFANYGLNSIEAVNLSGDLENALGRRLPPTLLWDYPTIEMLAEYLAEGTSEDVIENTPVNGMRPEEAQQLLDRLEQMPDAEVDALLNALLSQKDSD